MSRSMGRIETSWQLQPLRAGMTDVTGKRQGRMVVLGFIGQQGEGKRKVDYWICKCDCGNHFSVPRPALCPGKPTLSCGCLVEELRGKSTLKHGKSGTKTFKIFHGMRARCNIPSATHFENYGGRGIKVCERWSGDHGFQNFLSDMGECPPEHSIERRDPNGDYTPDNCFWMLKSKQVHNRTITIRLTRDGITKPLSEWCQDFNLDWKTVRSRMKNGWPEKDLFVPANALHAVVLTLDGETMRQSEFARRIGLDASSVSHKLKLGWTPEQIRDHFAQRKAA